MLPRWRNVRFCLTALAFVAGTAHLSAQGMDARRLGVRQPVIRAVADSATSGTRQAAASLTHPLDRIPLWSAPIASLIVPGLGQARLHHDRFVAYMAVEAYLLIALVGDHRDFTASSDSYRDIARSIARRNFVISPGATPPDSIWKYYESMEKWLESGSFTLVANGVTVPETDTLTFNGYQWLRARRQHGVPLDDPGAASLPQYGAAVAEYESRAVGQAYRWSWRNSQLAWDLYRRTIGRRNDANRQRTNDLIGIIANHLLSSVDAFANVRLVQAAGGTLHLSAAIPTP